jgi:hypothetical protein
MRNGNISNNDDTELKMPTINSVLCICEFLVLQNIHLEVSSTVYLDRTADRNGKISTGIQVQWVSQ